MLILEYISTHGTPGWCAARMSARESKGPLPASPTDHADVRVVHALCFTVLILA